MNLRRILFSAALCAIAGSARAQAPVQTPGLPRGAVAADSLRIYLLTMGPGDQLWELFGHNAIWVHDPRKLVDTVYNWGVFDFGAPRFLLHFLEGRNEYFMWPFTFDETIAQYRETNRDVWAQELNFTDAEKRALLDFLSWNAQPQNRPYRYNYYLDNCSTRVRDALDKAVNGQLRSQLRAIKTEQTYRSHSMRLMQGMPAIASGADLVLGEPTDFKLSADEAAFLPVQLMKELTPLRIDGGRPLFKESFSVFQATRGPEAGNAPKLWLWFLPISIALTALVAWLGGAARKGRHIRATAIAYGIVAAIFGILGTIILLLITVTDHTAAHRNFNGLMLNPLWLGVAVGAPMMLYRPSWRSPVARLLRLCGFLAIFTAVSHLGLSRQHNWEAMLLVLPTQLTMVWMLAMPRPLPARTLPDAPPGG